MYLTLKILKVPMPQVTLITRKIMMVNGCASMLGAFMGNPFPVTVYVGHAAYK